VRAVGLMLFMKLDTGEVLRRESGRARPKAERFLIGNPLIMKEMAKHVPDAASYAPVTLLVDERSDAVYLSYDKMTGFSPRTVMVPRWLPREILMLRSRD
jgi:uncharacterized protein (DUF302 family)